MSQLPAGDPVVEQLQARWRLAIANLGARAAAEEGAQAFALRTACSLEEGRAHVARAWRLLAISDRG